MENYYTTGKAAKYLGVDVHTVRRWCDNNEIEFIKGKNNYRYFTKEQLDAKKKRADINAIENLKKDADASKLITIHKASEILGVCMPTLRNWDKNGTLKAVRIGKGKRFYNLEDIEKMINGSLNQKEFYTVKEVAEIFNVTADTIRRWDKEGKLVSMRSPSGKRIYKEEQINSYKEKGKKEGL